MAQDSLFKDLCKPEVIKIGWHLAQLDSRDDFVEDPLRNADFASQLDVRLKYIIEQIASSRYRPRHLLDVDIPKSALTVRPGNVLPIEEATILQAIVYLTAPRLDPLLSKRVYSYRLHANWAARIKKGRSMFVDDNLELPFLKRSTIKRFDPMESWYIAWPEFDAARKSALKDKKYSHVTKTDISAYFENIDLRLLEDLLRQRLGNEPKLLALLFRILNGWTRDTASGVSIGRGLPQGNDISSFLANLYLLPLDQALDRFCKRTGGTWFRYVDDLDIFTKTYEHGREAILLVNQVLRSLHLNLQGSKTKILTGKALKDEYSHEDSDAAGDLIETLRQLDPNGLGFKRRRRTILAQANELARRFTRGLPASIRDLSAKDNRLLRRLFTLYGIAGSAHLKRTAIASLKEQPERRLFEKSLRYLRNLGYSYHDDIANELLAIGTDKTQITSFQLALIIQTVGQLHPQSPNKIASRIRKIGLLGKNEWLVKQKTLEALFNLPYKTEHAESVSKRWISHKHPWVRRAATLLSVKARQAFWKRTVDQLIFHPDSSMHLAALMWKRYETDSEFRKTELGRMRSIPDDHSFMRNASRLWAVTITSAPAEFSDLTSLLSRFDKSGSKVVRWHVSELKNRLTTAKHATAEAA